VVVGGGKTDQLFVKNFQLLNSSLKPLFTRFFGTSEEVVEANVEKAMEEFEEYQTYSELFVYLAQNHESNKAVVIVYIFDTVGALISLSMIYE
jgi:hypothetical protein